MDLELNLSPPRAESPNSTSVSSMELSLDSSSCVSSELSHAESPGRYSSSPEVLMSPMMLVGCPRCLMYVMLSDVDPKCPKCKSTVLLDFLNEEITKKTIN